MQHVIECRYQYRSREGVIWTDWFVCESKHLSDEEVKERIRQLYDASKLTDKVTKLKHEYRELDAAVYDEYHNNRLKEVERKKEEFSKIPRIKKPWLAKSRKERKELLEMDNADKVLYLANKRRTQS